MNENVISEILKIASESLLKIANTLNETKSTEKKPAETKKPETKKPSAKKAETKKTETKKVKIPSLEEMKLAIGEMNNKQGVTAVRELYKKYDDAAYRLTDVDKKNWPDLLKDFKEGAK